MRMVLMMRLLEAPTQQPCFFWTQLPGSTMWLPELRVQPRHKHPSLIVYNRKHILCRAGRKSLSGRACVHAMFSGTCPLRYSPMFGKSCVLFGHACDLVSNSISRIEVYQTYLTNIW